VFGAHGVRVQIPDHLECPDTLPEFTFDDYQRDLKRFYNCARTWCAQVGILDRTSINTRDDKAKHIKKISCFMNRVLGLNLQQQQILFGCATLRALGLTLGCMFTRPFEVAQVSLTCLCGSPPWLFPSAAGCMVL
jgi:hypothetical protein